MTGIFTTVELIVHSPPAYIAKTVSPAGISVSLNVIEFESDSIVGINPSFLCCLFRLPDGP